MKIRITFFYLSLLLLGLSACGDDEQPSPQLGSFTFEGRSFPLTKGFLIVTESDSLSGQQFGIALTSDGVSYNTEVDEFSGSGNLVIFTLRSTEREIPTSGSYTYMDNNEVFTFFEGGIAGDFDFQSGSGRVAGLVIDGSLGLQVQEGTYSINVDWSVVDALSGNLAVSSESANYMGPLEIINF